MVNKRSWLGILVIMLVLGVLLTGCESPQDEDTGGYTFEIKVENAHMGIITKIEFINGSNKNAPVLQTETVNLSKNDRTGVYKISGFTEKPSSGNDKDKKRICGIQITYENGDIGFGAGSSPDNRHILVKCDNVFDPPRVSFHDGDW